MHPSSFVGFNFLANKYKIQIPSFSALGILKMVMAAILNLFKICEKCEANFFILSNYSPLSNALTFFTTFKFLIVDRKCLRMRRILENQRCACGIS